MEPAELAADRVVVLRKLCNIWIKSEKAYVKNDNDYRASNAFGALDRFTDELGINLIKEPEVAVTGLLSDIMHFCKQLNINFNQLFCMAREQFNEEKDEKCD